MSGSRRAGPVVVVAALALVAAFFLLRPAPDERTAARPGREPAESGTAAVASSIPVKGPRREAPLEARRASEVETATDSAITRRGAILLAVYGEGEPVPEASVALRVQATGRRVHAGQTDIRGQIELGDLPPGIYAARIRAEGWGYDGAQRFEVAPGQRLSRRVDLIRGWRVRGRIAGSPEGCADVDAESLAAPWMSATRKHDLDIELVPITVRADGSFEERLKPGKYMFSAADERGFGAVEPVQLAGDMESLCLVLTSRRDRASTAEWLEHCDREPPRDAVPLPCDTSTRAWTCSMSGRISRRDGQAAYPASTLALPAAQFCERAFEYALLKTRATVGTLADRDGTFILTDLPCVSTLVVASSVAGGEACHSVWIELDARRKPHATLELEIVPLDAQASAP